MNETAVEWRPVTSSAAAYADENAFAMVFDFEAVKVTVVVTVMVYEDDKAAATSGEERVTQEATAAETAFFVEGVTVVETALEVTVVGTAEEVTVVTVEVTPSCACRCRSVR